MGKYIVGITGASGSIYADRFIRQLLKYKHQVILIITEAGKKVLKQELNLDLAVLRTEEEIESYLKGYFSVADHTGDLTYYDIGRIGAPISSGSFPVDGMIVLPCSMATVSAIARGASDNLLERAADVALKERKRLIVVPREAPLNVIHLQNLLLLAQCNVRIIPASPSFYHLPETIEELVGFFVGRIMDQLGIEHDFIKRWEGI